MLPSGALERPHDSRTGMRILWWRTMLAMSGVLTTSAKRTPPSAPVIGPM